MLLIQAVYIYLHLIIMIILLAEFNIHKLLHAILLNRLIQANFA